MSDKSDSSKQIRTLTINENGDWEYLGEKTAKSKIQHERTVCDDCRGCWEYLKSDCMGEEETCKAFFPKVSLSQREMSHWPEYGDATYYRIHGKWRE